ncbi:MAG: transporter [Desulfobacterales bacterium]|nr:transporter [Desulfobacterales bacterium]
MMISNLAKAILIVVVMTGTAFGAHPLITDDTGTNGRGKFQVELTGEFAYDKEKSGGITVKEKGYEAGVAVSAGLLDTLDIVCGIPYQWNRTEEDGAIVSDEDGISDIGLELKWRFFEQNDLSFALKPGITIPSGDEDTGLGTGKVCYGATFIATKEIDPLTLHINLGYTHNDYKLKADEESSEKDLWHISLAGVYEVSDNLQVVVNIGVERNPDKESGTDPSFVLIGLIYSITPDLDVDLGFKAGLSGTETDAALLTGLTMRF